MKPKVIQKPLVMFVGAAPKVQFAPSEKYVDRPDRPQVIVRKERVYVR